MCFGCTSVSLVFVVAMTLDSLITAQPGETEHIYFTPLSVTFIPGLCIASCVKRKCSYIVVVYYPAVHHNTLTLNSTFCKASIPLTHVRSHTCNIAQETSSRIHCIRLEAMIMQCLRVLVNAEAQLLGDLVPGSYLTVVFRALCMKALVPC